VLLCLAAVETLDGKDGWCSGQIGRAEMVRSVATDVVVVVVVVTKQPTT